MLYGHAVSALLAPGYQSGTLFDAWQFQRGLTSSLFLTLSGFAFSVATTRHWGSHLRLTWPVVRRARRFLTFVLLGYALHFPVGRFALLPTASEGQWQSFLAVDVLQLIGVTFIAVQLLVVVIRVRIVFSAVALALAAVILVVTPWVWSATWTETLPLWAASYLTPATGSQFPLFPWGAYVLLGASLGLAYGHLGAGNLPLFANGALLLPAAALVLVGVALRGEASTLFGEGPGTFVPPEVLIRAGACLAILGAMAHGSRYIARLPHVFGAVAQESLLIYFVHLCIVYGSVWNVGLAQVYGQSLEPRPVFGIVVGLIALMVALAWQWNGLKHTSPRAARWITGAVATALVIRLL
jgi:uncharacterized membrane protein